MTGAVRRVTLVVVTHNSAEVVGDLLDSIPAAARDVTTRIVVVDNASTDGTLDLVRGRGGCTVVEHDNRGYAAGVNRGAAETDAADDLLVLNPDVVLRPGAIDELVRAGTRPGVGIVAPKVLDLDGSLSFSLRNEPGIRNTLGLARLGGGAFAEYITDRRRYELPGAVDWALGAVLLVTAECRAVVGEWDETFFLYSEETDYCLRARDAGYSTWYQPSAVAIHIGGASGRSPQTHAMQIVNRVRLHSRRHTGWSGGVRNWTFFGLTLAREAVWIPRAGARSRAAASALIRPSRRPPQLGDGQGLLPR